MNYDAILENKSPGFLQHFERKKVIYFPEHCKIRKNHFRDTAKTKNMFFFRKKSTFLKMIVCVLIRISKQV